MSRYEISNTVATGSGTSFACPNMAGLSTILWQAFPEFNNMQIIYALREAGSIFFSPNARIGYGIPNVKNAFGNLLTRFATSTATVNGCRIFINWTSKDINGMKYELERKAPGELNYTKIADINPTASNKLTNHNYEFINTLATGTSGIFAYRIRQIIDADVASFTAIYIDSTTANVSSPCVVTGVVNPPTGNNIIRVQPNPAVSSDATLFIETTEAITNMPVLIYDMNGRLMMRLRFSKGTGQTNVTIPTGKLARGKYVIKVYNKNKSIGTVELIRL
jgi:hypothetical protein